MIITIDSAACVGVARRPDALVAEGVVIVVSSCFHGHYFGVVSAGVRYVIHQDLGT